MGFTDILKPKRHPLERVKDLKGSRSEGDLPDFAGKRSHSPSTSSTSSLSKEEKDKEKDKDKKSMKRGDSSEWRNTLRRFNITKDHWKSDSDVTECYNLSCRKQFSFVDRKHHCRRCGNIYCSDCLSYEMRLSLDAKPDPNGIMCKVCSTCYADGPGLDSTKSLPALNILSPEDYRRTPSEDTLVPVNDNRIPERYSLDDNSVPRKSMEGWTWSTF